MPIKDAGIVLLFSVRVFSQNWWLGSPNNFNNNNANGFNANSDGSYNNNNVNNANGVRPAFSKNLWLNL